MLLSKTINAHERIFLDMCCNRLFLSEPERKLLVQNKSDAILYTKLCNGTARAFAFNLFYFFVAPCASRARVRYECMNQSKESIVNRILTLVDTFVRVVK